MRKFIFLLVIILSSCNQTTMFEIEKENLLDSGEGFIQEIEKFKGGGYLITIKKETKFKKFGVYKTVGEVCKKNDYFIKFKNSNKCLLKRNDSLICVDCINIEKETRDSLNKIEEWKNFKKNKWQKIKTPKH